jgi:hypothetical protein
MPKYTSIVFRTLTKVKEMEKTLDRTNKVRDDRPRVMLRPRTTRNE